MAGSPRPSGSVFVGLDKAILRETQREAVASEEREKPASQQASEPAGRSPGEPAGQLPGEPASQQTGVAAQAGVLEASSSRIKATYRLRPEAIDALEDCRRVLRREHGLKVTREQIVEAALIAAHADLIKGGTASLLASQLSGKPASREPGAWGEGGGRKKNG